MSETPPIGQKTPQWVGHFMVLHHHQSLLIEMFFGLFFFLKEIFDIYLCSNNKERFSAWLQAFACSYIQVPLGHLVLLAIPLESFRSCISKQDQGMGKLVL